MGAFYGYEFKLHVAEDYYDGTLSYTVMANRYRICTKRLIEKWIIIDKIYGKNSLKLKEEQTNDRSFHKVLFSKWVQIFSSET